MAVNTCLSQLRVLVSQYLTLSLVLLLTISFAASFAPATAKPLQDKEKTLVKKYKTELHDKLGDKEKALYRHFSKILPGVKKVHFTDVTFDQNFIAGKLQIEKYSVQIVVFRENETDQPKLGLMFDEPLSLGKLSPEFAKTVMDDFQLSTVAFILVPEGSRQRGVSMPPVIASRLNAPVLDLHGGMNFFALADLSGEAARFMEFMGQKTKGLHLRGKIDQRMFRNLTVSQLPQSETGDSKQSSLKLSQLKSQKKSSKSKKRTYVRKAVAVDLLKSLNLSINLRNLDTPWTPSFLQFQNANFTVKGKQQDNGKTELALGITTNLSLRIAGKTPVVFKKSEIVWYPEKGGIKLHSSEIKPPADLLAISGNSVVLNSLSFDGQSNANQFSASLSGQFSLHGGVHTFIAALSDGQNGARYSVKVNGESTLAQLAGWNLPGMDEISVGNLSISKDFTSGTLSVAGMDWNVVLFKSDKQSQANVALTRDKPLRLSQVNKSLAGTPLNDIEFANPMFLFAPQSNANTKTSLPAPLAKHSGKSSIVLPSGLGVHAAANWTGKAAEFLQHLDITAEGLPLSGKIDPALFQGKALAKSAMDMFIANLDLSVPVSKLQPQWAPKFIRFSNGNLTIKGVQASDGTHHIAIATETDATVNFAKRGVSFSHTTMGWDPAKKTITVSSANIKPKPGLLSLPNIAAEVDWLSLDASIAKDSKQFSVHGQFSVQGKAEKFSAELSDDNGTAKYALSVSGKATLAQLSGWDVPVLKDIEVDNVNVANGYSSGEIKVAGLPWTIVVFKTGNSGKSNVALMYDKPLKLSTLMPALADTPLDDLQMKNPGFIFTPSENDGSSSKLPPPLASHLGVSSLTFKKGLDLRAIASLQGKAGELLNMAGASAGNGLPLSGELNPAIFASAGSAGKKVMQSFIAMLDINIPLKDVKVPAFGSMVDATQSRFRIKGAADGKGFDAGIETALKVKAGRDSLAFTGHMVLSEKAGDKSLQVDAELDAGHWSNPLGIHWLTINNVALDIELGKEKKLSVNGTTSLGDIHNLNASAFVTATGNKISDMGLALLNADIPLSDIPGISNIPDADHFKFRNLYLTEKAISGTLKTNVKALRALNNTTATLFQSNAHWNLAILKENLSFSDLIALPSVAKPIFKPIKMEKALIVLSEGNDNITLSALPEAAQSVFSKVYETDGDSKKGGSSQNTNIRLIRGLQLMSALDLGAFARGLSKIGHSTQPPVFSGAIGGIFGGPASVNLSADIPKISIPRSLSFMQLPKDFQTYLFVSLQDEDEQVDAAVGVGLDVHVNVNAKPKPVQFATSIKFEADTSGGFEIDVQGKTDSAWVNAMSIKGLTFEPGTRLEVKASADAEVTVTFVGNTKMGNKLVELIGSASVLPEAGVIDKVAFEGSISSLSMDDLLSVANKIITAGGGKALKPGFPDATLKNVDIAFASPGVDVPEMHLVGGGQRMAGELWLIFKDSPMGKFLVQLDANGLIVNGNIHDFSVAGVGLNKTALDAKALISPPEAYFKGHGQGKLLGISSGIDIILGTQTMDLKADINLGKMLEFDFQAGTTFPQGASMSALAKSDMSLNTHLKADLSGWLRSSGMQRVQKTLGNISKSLADADKKLKQAQGKVNELNAKIASTREQVKKDRSKSENALKTAQQSVDHYKGHLSGLDRDIKDAKHHIHGCHYTKKTFLGKVPDVGRNIRCESDNAKYGSIVAEKTAEKKTVQASLKIAEGALAAVKRGETNIPVDADPRVAALITELATANTVLNAASSTVEGTRKATDQINNVIDSAKKPGVFAVKDSLIRGSLKKSILGQPAVIGIDLEVMGSSYKYGLAYSMTDQTFNADQFDAITMLILTQVVKSNKNVPPFIVQTLHDEYLKKHQAIDARLQKALKDNGLD